MSTPFPMEDAEQASNSTPKWDPWDGPVKPGVFSGLGFDEDTAFAGPVYRGLEAMGSGALKGAAVLHGLEGSIWGGAADVAESVGLPSETLRSQEALSAQYEHDARARAKDLTPNPATTGIAAQTLHGVVEGAYLMTTGAAGGVPGAMAAVGGTEGVSRYKDLREQGVDATTATAAGVLTGAASAAGVVMPAAYGTSLITRLATGAAANTAFGAINRYGDSKILELGGYQEMADQQKVWDSTQILVDVALGATFGGVHHLMAAHEVEALRTPDNRDAALTANLALRDRQSGPGVPVDPESANAHQEALEKAIGDISADKDVDVSDTGVIDGRYMERPERDLTPENKIFFDTLRESGLFHEEARLKDMEDALEARRNPEEASPREVRSQEQVDAGETVPTDPVAAALDERPALKIATEEGPVKASDAIEQAKEAHAINSDEAPKATEALAACAGRR